VSWIKRIIRRLLPDDKTVRCGYSIFSLPRDHPFERACGLHDYQYELAHKGINEQTLLEADWDLFYRFVLIAKAAPTPEARCRLGMTICKIWPLARLGGAILWDGVELKAVLPRPPISTTVLKDEPPKEI